VIVGRLFWTCGNWFIIPSNLVSVKKIRAGFGLENRFRVSSLPRLIREVYFTSINQIYLIDYYFAQEDCVLEKAAKDTGPYP
jgi:hypothetical protein